MEVGVVDSMLQEALLLTIETDLMQNNYQILVSDKYIKTNMDKWQLREYTNDSNKIYR